MNNVVKIETPNQLSVIDYNVTEAGLAELRKKHVAIAVTSNKDLATIQKSITELVTLRTSVEKKRKELKADALEFGRKVDREAERVTGLLKEIEQPLVDAKQIWNDEQERIKAEKARLEQERIDTIMNRIASILEIPSQMAGKSSDDIAEEHLKLTDELIMGDGFDYQEFAEKAQSARKTTLEKLGTMRESRKIWEEEQAAEVIRKQEAEAARIELEAAQDKLREEQRIFAEKQAESERLEAEKNAAARKAQESAEHAQRLADLEREKAENARLVEIENKRLAVEREQLELDKQRAEHEAKVTADKAREEREEMQRKLREESLITQAAPDMLVALEYFYNISHDLRNSIDKGYIQVAQEQAKSAINKARGLS